MALAKAAPTGATAATTSAVVAEVLNVFSFTIASQPLADFHRPIAGGMGAGHLPFIGCQTLIFWPTPTKSRCPEAQARIATSLGTLEHLPRDELPGHSVLTDELLRFVAIAARHHLCVFDGRVITLS